MRFEVQAKLTRCTAFDQLGSRLLVTSHKAFAIFDTASGERLRDKNPFVESPYGNTFYFADLSPDGTLIVAGESQKTIRLWDAVTLEAKATLNGHFRLQGVRTVRFSSDGRYLASGSDDQTTRVWDVRDHSVTDVIGIQAFDVAFDSDGERMVMAVERVSADDAAPAGAVLAQLSKGSSSVLYGHVGFLYHATFSPDGSLIASSGIDNTFRLWDAITGAPLAVFDHALHNKPCAVGFSLDGSALIGDHDSWDVETGLQLGGERPDFWRLVAGGTKSTFTSGQSKCSSKDRSRLVVGGGSGVGVYEGLAIVGENTVSSYTSERLRFTPGDRYVHAVAISADNGLIATGGTDAIIRIFNAHTANAVAEMTGHTDTIYSLEFSRDGSRLVSGSNDLTIRLWDLGTFEEAVALRGHTGYVHSVAFSPDGSQLVSASGDGTVRIWDTVPAAERFAQARAAEALREKAAPMVDQLLAEQGNAIGVAAHLRADTSLDTPTRRAALRVLLSRSQAARIANREGNDAGVEN